MLMLVTSSVIVRQGGIYEITINAIKNTLIIKVKTSIYMTDPTVEEDDLRDYWRLKSDKLSHAQYPQEDDRDRQCTERQNATPTEPHGARQCCKILCTVDCADNVINCRLCRTMTPVNRLSLPRPHTVPCVPSHISTLPYDLFLYASVPILSLFLVSHHLLFCYMSYSLLQ